MVVGRYSTPQGTVPPLAKYSLYHRGNVDGAVEASGGKQLGSWLSWAARGVPACHSRQTDWGVWHHLLPCPREQRSPGPVGTLLAVG